MQKILVNLPRIIYFLLLMLIFSSCKKDKGNGDEITDSIYGSFSNAPSQSYRDWASYLEGTQITVIPKNSRSVKVLILSFGKADTLEDVTLDSDTSFSFDQISKKGYLYIHDSIKIRVSGTGLYSKKNLTCGFTRFIPKDSSGIIPEFNNFKGYKFKN